MKYEENVVREAIQADARANDTDRVADEQERDEKVLQILFGIPMVRALLARRKRMTRRIVREPIWQIVDGMPRAAVIGFDPKCPYGGPGTKLRVKESAWMWCERVPDGLTRTGGPRYHYVPLRGAPVHYAANRSVKPTEVIPSPETGNPWGWHLKIGRFLPAWASRLMVEVEAVRVERLQDITASDAIDEGVEPMMPGADPVGAFGSLWETIHGPQSWQQNPFVWVVTFKVLDIEDTLTQPLQHSSTKHLLHKQPALAAA